jgi:hypothetical protein
MLQVDGQDLNRMGDALAALPWMWRLARRHDGLRVVDDQLFSPLRPLLPDEMGIYFGPGRPDGPPTLKVDIHDNFHFCGVRGNVHMCQGYFISAGERPPLLPVTLPLLDDGPADLCRSVVVSPYSRSDHRHNKAWFDDRWNELIAAVLLHPDVDEVVILSDGIDDTTPLLAPNTRVMESRPLREVLSALRGCRLVISVDNGISHLAHFGGVSRHLLLAPACLPAAFVANPRGRSVRGEPVAVRATTMIDVAREMLGS